MAGPIDFAGLIDDESAQCEKDILAIFEHALNSSGDLTTTADRIIDGLRELFRTSDSEYEADRMLWILWMNLLALVMMAPIDHPWQRVFIDVVEGLRRRGGPVTEAENVSIWPSTRQFTLNLTQIRGPQLLWEDLPNLRMYVFDKFAGKYDRVARSPTVLLCHLKTPRTWKIANSKALKLGRASTGSCVGF